MKENLRPFGYLDEYIDMLDVSAETKGEIRDKLIDNIQKNNKIHSDTSCRHRLRLCRS